MQTIELKTLHDTERLAKKIAKALHGGDVLALSGPLGSGKTTFTQALGRALGAPPEVKSPTFVVMHVHQLGGKGRRQKARLNKLFLCHVDAYRITNPQELEAVGLGDYLGDPDTITVVEWAEKIRPLIPKQARWLTFSLTKDKRTVTLR